MVGTEFLLPTWLSGRGWPEDDLVPQGCVFIWKVVRNHPDPDVVGPDDLIVQQDDIRRGPTGDIVRLHAEGNGVGVYDGVVGDLHTAGA